MDEIVARGWRSQAVVTAPRRTRTAGGGAATGSSVLPGVALIMTMLSSLGLAGAAAPIDGAVRKGFTVTGAVTPAVYQLYGVNDRREWRVRLTLDNATPYGVELGTDMVVVESDETGGTFLGVYHARGRTRPAGMAETSDTCEWAAQYGLTDFELQWADGTSQGYSDGGTYTFRDAGSPQRDPSKLTFGRLAAGASLALEADLLQGRWLRFEHAASLRVALPELVVSAAGASHRYRAVAYFAKPAAADLPWPLARLEVVPLEPGSLLATLLTPEENVVTRVFAANWLRDVDPAAAAGGAARVATTVASGDLLAACFSLLLASPAAADADLVAHARGLLAGSATPDGIRTLAGSYLAHVGAEAPEAPSAAAAPQAATPAPPPSAPPAVTPADDGKRQLQEHYLAFLRSEGFLPEVDVDGDVHFKREGYSYYIVLDAGDPRFLRILLPNIWRIEGDEQRALVLAACDRTSRVTKVAKAYTSGDFASLSVEMLLPEQDDVGAVFGRSMGILDSARSTFTAAMRE